MLRLRFVQINKTISPALKRLIVEITYKSPASRGDKIKNKLISQTLCKKKQNERQSFSCIHISGILLHREFIFLKL